MLDMQLKNIKLSIMLMQMLFFNNTALPPYALIWLQTVAFQA